MSKIAIIGDKIPMPVMLENIASAEPPIRKGFFIGFDDEGDIRMWSNQMSEAEMLMLARCANADIEGNIFVKG